MQASTLSTQPADSAERHQHDEEFVTISGLKVFEDEDADDEEFVTISGLKVFEDETEFNGHPVTA